MKLGIGLFSKYVTTSSQIGSDQIGSYIKSFLKNRASDEETMGL